MTKSENLWAVGYNDMERASHVRNEIIRLGWGTTHYLMLDDLAVIVRHPDGSFTLNREKFPAASNIVGFSVVGFLAGLVVGAPMTGATIGAMVGGAGSVAVLASAGIGEDFVKEVKALMKPGTSAIFVLDHEGDMDVILGAIRGLGGTVLKTNVDLERAQLIQSTLAAPSTQPGKIGRQVVSCGFKSPPGTEAPRERGQKIRVSDGTGKPK
jgi:uncharacterized membrane protein